MGAFSNRPASTTSATMRGYQSIGAFTVIQANRMSCQVAKSPGREGRTNATHFSQRFGSTLVPGLAL